MGSSGRVSAVARCDVDPFACYFCYCAGSILDGGPSSEDLPDPVLDEHSLSDLKGPFRGLLPCWWGSGPVSTLWCFGRRFDLLDHGLLLDLQSLQFLN